MEFNSIEDAASALGVSVRQGWRYLRQGRILRQNKAGDTVFTVSDIPDTDSGTDMAADNGTVPYHKPVSVNKLSVPDKKSHVINSLQTELTASRLQFQIEQSEASRSAWLRRQDSERRADLERQASLEAQKLRLASEAKEKSKAEKLKAVKMQRLKAQLLPSGVRDIIPSGIQAQIIMEISKLAGDIEILSFEDMLCIGMASRDKILTKNYDSVAQAFSDYGRSLMVARAKQLYQELKVLAAK